MKASRLFSSLPGCLLGFAGLLYAQEPPRFTGIQRLTSNETLLQVSAAAGVNYRIDASTNLVDWISLITVLSTGSNQHTNFSAPISPAGRRNTKTEHLYEIHDSTERNHPCPRFVGML